MRSMWAFALLLFCCLSPAYAGGGKILWQGQYPVSASDCASVQAVVYSQATFDVKEYPLTCSAGADDMFTFRFQKNSTVYLTGQVIELCDTSRFTTDMSKAIGQRCVRIKCFEGDSVGSYKVPTAYYQSVPHVLKQPIINDGDLKNYKTCIQGCVARATSVSSCDAKEVVGKNLELYSCTVAFEEMGQTCQIWSDLSDRPEFTGSVGDGTPGSGGSGPDDPAPGGGGGGGTPGGGGGTSPGGGTGGGTGPGDGTSPSGGTGPGGGTGGGGGGTGPGGGTGGGDTPGTGGGGGGGGTNPGDTQGCGLPSQPACRIDEAGMPSVPSDVGENALKGVENGNKAGLDVAGGVSKESIGLFSWFPSIPTASCRNPSVANPITGSLIEVQICSYIDIFSTFISGVICFFVLIGCVQQVQSALKA